MGGFNHKVHERDPKTGLVNKSSPYRMRVSREHGTTYIRDGKEYFPDGTVKRSLNPQPKQEVQVAAPIQAPAQVEAPAAVEAPVTAPSAEETELGIPSSAEMAKKATKGEIRRAK